MNTMRDCKHCGEYLPKSGAEAEDLRSAIEKLIKYDALEYTVHIDDIQSVLDEVDARDSLKFLEEQ